MLDEGARKDRERDPLSGTLLKPGLPAESRAEGLEAAATYAAPWGYRLMRRLLRLWFRLFLPRVRLLGASDRAAPAGGMLLVWHPASFLDAMVLVSVLDMPVHAVLPRDLMQGFFRGRLAEVLRMIPLEEGPEGIRDALDECIGLAADGECVLIFGEQTLRKLAGSLPRQLAEQLARGNAPEVSVVPVYLFVPFQRAQSAEILIYIDEALSIKADAEEAVKAEKLRKQLEESSGQGRFSLREADMREFLADLEKILVQNLAEDWAARKNWKQHVEGFRLSGLACEWVQGLNRRDPGRLVALREMLATLREAARIRSLHEIELQLNSAKMKSWGWQFAVWTETLAGFPIALFGAINHAIALGILKAAGFLRSGPERNPALAWGVRGMIVVATYVLQVALVYHFRGRGAAGYYAPALPVTGLYLWRYAWLVKNRLRLAFLGMRVRGENENVGRLRRLLVEEVSKGTAAFVGAPGEG
jgi:1-acyl-sn-glycerol-3-phosphate acyltransferase